MTDADALGCRCQRCEESREQWCHSTCRSVVEVPPQPTARARGPASPLTWQEQQEALVLLRYWWEYNRGGLPMDEAVLLFTKALFDKHPAGGR